MTDVEQKQVQRKMLHQMEQERRAQFLHALPGSRSDGGMLSRGEEPQGFPAPQSLQATHAAIQHIITTETQLRHLLEDTQKRADTFEKEAMRLTDALVTEQTAREHLERTIRQIAEIVVNGSKANGT